MSTLTDVFSHLCGQQNPMVCEGRALPVCARCFGLYIGAAMTAGWVLAAGLWRRGLPSWSVFLLHVSALLVGLAGGLHLLADSIFLRLLCGLWTGHVAMVWLAGGGQHLWRLARANPPAQIPWRTIDKVQSAMVLGLLAALAWVLPELARCGRWVWSVIIVAGAAALGVGALFGLTGLVAWGVRRASASLRDCG